MSYLLLSLITIISLYSHPTISADFSINAEYKLSTDTVYAIYNPSSRQYMGFDGYDIMFVDDISDDYNTKWQIELQHEEWHSFALKNVGTGLYILYENLNWRLKSTGNAYNEWYMGFTADFHGIGDVENLPTVHIWTKELAGIQYRMETFTYINMGWKKISALCNTHTASLLSTNIRNANDIKHNCGGLNEAKFIFVPEYDFSIMRGFSTIISADRWPRSGCKALTDNCNNWCNTQEINNERCDALDNEHCWIAGFITGKICKCKCYTEWVGDCSLDGIIRSTESCPYTNIDYVDDEVAESIGFNIAFSILGAVPKAGVFTNMAWAAWSNSPKGPISSPQQLTNALITNINEKFDDLTKCFDTKLINLRSDLYAGLVREIGRQYGLIVAANGPDKIENINNLWSTFNGYISNIFEDDVATNTKYNYQSYESLLPVYTTLIPFYVTLAGERLAMQKRQNDDHNFDVDVLTAKVSLNVMKQWILRAKQSIVNSFTSNHNPRVSDCSGLSISGSCVYQNEWTIGCGDSILNAYYYEFKPRYITSNERGTECGYNLPDADNRHRPFSQVCNYWNNNFIITTKNLINNEVSAWKNKFDGKYLTKVNLYIESLERIEDGEDTSDNILKDNILEIRNMNNKCVAIYHDKYVSNENGEFINVWDCNDTDNMKWYYDMDTKQIKNKKEKCLDINAEKKNGRALINNCDGGDSQKFEYNWTTLQIKNVKGKCLAITGDHYDRNVNGGHVIGWDCHGDDNQKFNLYPDFIKN